MADTAAGAEVRADTYNARLSPDGTKVVLTDDFFRAFDEPDVWVFDVTSGEVDHLTDDGVDDFDISGTAAPGHTCRLTSSTLSNGMTTQAVCGGRTSRVNRFLFRNYRRENRTEKIFGWTRPTVRGSVTRRCPRASMARAPPRTGA